MTTFPLSVNPLHCPTRRSLSLLLIPEPFHQQVWIIPPPKYLKILLPQALPAVISFLCHRTTLLLPVFLPAVQPCSNLFPKLIANLIRSLSIQKPSVTCTYTLHGFVSQLHLFRLRPHKLFSVFQTNRQRFSCLRFFSLILRHKFAQHSTLYFSSLRVTTTAVTCIIYDPLMDFQKGKNRSYSPHISSSQHWLIVGNPLILIKGRNAVLSKST